MAEGPAVSGAETLAEHSMVGEFEILGIIGEGGFGTVYLAMDHSLSRKVALKEYRPAALATRTGHTVVLRSQRHAEAFAAGLKSFINEARTLARFDHPALVRVYRFWQENGTAYMAMPLVSGRTLTSFVRESRAQIDEAWLHQVAGPLMDAVEALHGVQIFHRDIAPDNILIQSNGAPVLLDFGAARQIVSEMTQALTVILKPGYAPVEQYAEDEMMKQGPWTDIYALGAILHFAVTGRPPPNSVTRLVNDTMRPLHETPSAGFSVGFLAAIDRALAVRPEARPQSIAELRELFGMRTFGPDQGGIPDGRAGAAAGASHPTHSPTALGESRATQSTISDPNTTILIPRAEQTRTAPARDVPAPAVAQPAARSDRPTAAPIPKKSKRAMIWTVAALAVLALLGVVIKSQFPADVAPEPTPANQGSPASPVGGTADKGSTPNVEPPASLSTAPATAPAATDAPVKTDATPNVGDAAKSPGTAEDAKAAAPAQPTGQGRVLLAIKPWAAVSVDGVDKGVTPPLKTLTLPVGKHTIELSNPGFPNHVVEVEIEKDKRVTISYEFK